MNPRQPERRTFRGTESQLFVLAVVLPLVALDLAVTISRLAQRYDIVAGAEVSPWVGGPALALYAMIGDAAFALFACVLLCVRNQGGKLWVATAMGLQVCAVHVGLLDISSYAYFLQTFDALDAPLLRHMLRQPGDLGLVLAGEVTFSQWCVLALLFAVVMIAPWVLRSRARKRAVPPYPGKERRSRKKAWALCMASAPVALCGVFGPPVAVKDVALARSPLLHVAVSAVAPYQVDPKLDQVVAEARVFEPGELTVKRDPSAPAKNLVFIVLESTRARSTTPYAPKLLTTPFMAKLAKQSLVVDKAYAVMPSTAKALTAIFCSIIPSPTIVPVALNQGLLGGCLPHLMAEQGYETVYLQSANPRFEGRMMAVPAMGFHTFVKEDEMPHEGMQEANFLGFEDDSMLLPAQAWLTAHKDKPFMMGFLTVDAHHDYNRLTRHGVKHFAQNGDDLYDRYLNNLYAQDAFLQSLFGLYEKADLLDKTLFVIVGDHGEGFGEHGRLAHNAVPYEEGLRVPLMFYDPSHTLFEPGRLPGPISELDIMPTVLKMLGYRVTSGRMHGMSVFDSPPDRVLMSSCLGDCATRTTDTEAFIHHYGRRPDELFDLRTDPEEKNDLAAQYPQLVESRRQEVLQFQRRVASYFFMHELEAEQAHREEQARREEQAQREEQARREEQAQRAEQAHRAESAPLATGR